MWNPRVGGEKLARLYSSVPVPGSPPRGRGKEDQKAAGQRFDGITPAWAGKSSSGRGLRCGCRDHPHTGGEKKKPLKRPRAPLESPPRRRGKEEPSLEAKRIGRITPAWAGKSRSRSRRCSGGRDHPRVGGEKEKGRALTHYALGSPPRGRGKECTGDTCKPNTRITPAWAGKSAVPVVIFSIAWDHPRVGGEKWSAVRVCRHGWGSPPRGRGKEDVLFDLRWSVRITPAWAGKSQASQPWSPPLWIMVIRPRP